MVSSDDEVVGVIVSVVVVAAAVCRCWLDAGVGAGGELEHPPKTTTKLINAQEVWICRFTLTIVALKIDRTLRLSGLTQR